MKALVLAGGRGKRVNEHSDKINKCMINIAGRPVIENSLDSAIDSDVDEIVIVVGYRAEDIINYYGNNYKGTTIKYVIQWERHGLVHAMECARETLNGDDFMLVLGDEVLVNPRHKEMLESFRTQDVFVMCGLLYVEDKEQIKNTYTVFQGDDNTIYRLVEKPKNPLNHLMGTGVCIFKNKIFDYIPYIPINHIRKEKELPDLIQCAVDDGLTVRSFIICDNYSNINTVNDIHRGNKITESQ